MTDHDYDKAIVWCKKKIENVKKHNVLSGKRLEGYEEAMLCVMSYLHCEKDRAVDMTNAQKIRSMSDEELQRWFCKGRECWTCPFRCWNRCTFNDWIKQPAASGVENPR